MIGESIGKTIYQTGLARYEGMYIKIHAFAHSMFIFIFMFLLFLTLKKNEKLSTKLYFYILYFLCFVAIFNLFKSYTRNVWIGLSIVWVFYLWGQKKRLILALSISVAAVVAIVSSDFKIIFFDFIEPLSGERHINSLGAGRLGMWTNVINLFNKLPLEVKLMGVGIGEAKIGFGIARGHNDFLSLLYSTGLIGLFFYITFLFRVGYDILKSRIGRKLKYLYLGFLFAVVFMNFASNSYLSRIEMSQYFYFVLGTFYFLSEKFNKSEARHGKP
jgi:O-antigen ligase